MDKRLFEVEEIAGYLSVTKNVVRSWVSERKIPYIEIGGLIKFDLRKIDAWIEENSVEPVTEEKQAKPEIEEQTKKECSNCFKEKPLDEFHRNIRGKNGRSSLCKVCGNVDAARRWKERKKIKKEVAEKEEGNKGKQLCNVCGEEKSFDEFYKDPRLKGGRSHQCKICVRAKQAERDRVKKERDEKKEEKEDEKEKIPWAVGGECEILNNKGEIIFKNGKAFGKEGEEWLRKKRLLEEKRNE